ncbi:MAG: Uncharacterized protein FD162_479 [Rhodobacteraceae bacterium]|uniref:hypothetical protein n=1 Tax=Cypionkella sp. TaxID=2811411 RepID=UPI00132AC231|nr:hypothetical protein [Cypionkella sp.]KAF0175508.1 MAG: Uncharacterized protein FD162_479 [Paracoccaceae bacterium]
MKCEFHRTEMQTQRANAHYPGAKEFAPKRVAIGWCAHAASPAPKGAQKPLTCGGDLAKCLIKDKL